MKQNSKKADFEECYQVLWELVFRKHINRKRKLEEEIMEIKKKKEY